jgi:hypothetical protein
MGERMTQKQSEWDDLLIECFYKHPDVPMYRLTLYNNFGEKLKRIPRQYMECLTVTRYVSGHLPRLAAVLWRSKYEDKARIVKALANSPMDTAHKSVDVAKCKQEKVDEDGRRAVLASQTLGWQARRDWRQATSRSAWTTCK